METLLKTLMPSEGTCIALVFIFLAATVITLIVKRYQKQRERFEDQLQEGQAVWGVDPASRKITETRIAFVDRQTDTVMTTTMGNFPIEKLLS
jgi:hypothetical protein